MTLLDLQGMTTDPGAKPPPGSRASKGCFNTGSALSIILCSLF